MGLNQAQVEPSERLTLDLWPETGRILGLSRGATFVAARRGEIPTVRIGRRILVPKAALAKLLGMAEVREDA